jgi:uncharacterized protein YdeI (YjbR/CyaY-like superfamily)
MHASGLAVFEMREDKRTAIYAYEQRKGAQLPAAYEKNFRANAAAWKFYQAQPPGYRRTSSWWVIGAKKEETRRKRLATLMECSEKGKAIPALARPRDMIGTAVLGRG